MDGLQPGFRSFLCGEGLNVCAVGRDPLGAGRCFGNLSPPDVELFDAQVLVELQHGLHFCSLPLVHRLVPRETMPQRLPAAAPFERSPIASSRMALATSSLLIFSSGFTWPSGKTSVTMLVSDSKPAPACVTSLATIMSRFFSRIFAAAFSSR